MKTKACALFCILALLLVLAQTAMAVDPIPGSPCKTKSGMAGRWFGTPDNMKCAGLGESCPAKNGPGVVFGTPGNMKCAGLGESCPAKNGPGVVVERGGQLICVEKR